MGYFGSVPPADVSKHVRSHFEMKIVAVSNQKGGVGKTTTSINLSVALAQRGVKVLLIDLDPQANATSGLGHEPDGELSMYRPLIGEASVDGMIQQSRFENLSLIAADLDLAGVEIELAGSADHLTRLRSLITESTKASAFDFCILDTPPSLGVLMTSALASADEVLIPLQCEWFGLEGLAKIVSVIDQIREAGANTSLTLGGILMTMYDGRTNLSKQVVDEVTKYFPEQIYKSVIPRTIRIGEAPSHGKTIFEHAGSSIGAQAYGDMADEFLERHGIALPEDFYRKVKV